MSTRRTNGSDGSQRSTPFQADVSDGETDAIEANGKYRQSYVDRITLSRALVAGVIGGIVFGIPLQFVIERMAAIGAMYTFGEPSVTVGWVAHIGHSALFGVIFGLLTELEPAHSWMERGIGTAGLVGIVFAVGLYATNIAFFWPTWLHTVGYAPAAAWTVPHTPLQPFLGHVLWGVITGTVFHYLVDY